MLKNFKFHHKFLFAFLLTGFIAIAAIGWQSYQTSRAALKETSLERLTATRETKKRQVETYFRHVKNQVSTFSEDHMIIEATKELKKAFHDIIKESRIKQHDISGYLKALDSFYKNDFATEFSQKNPHHSIDIVSYIPKDLKTILLQYYYIAQNQNPIGAKDDLASVSDNSTYSKIHSKYHPIIQNYLKKFDYYDIFLVDNETGHILYSVFKEIDFASSLLTGPLSDTNIARVFKETRNSPRKHFTKLTDFEHYHPSYGAPASFIASPVFDGNRQIGVLIFQMPVNALDRIMTGEASWAREGLGKSGETFIVGSDLKMRSNARFLIEAPEKYFSQLELMDYPAGLLKEMKEHSTSILFQTVPTKTAKSALRGFSDTKTVMGYRHTPVLSSYSPLNIEDLHWALMSEMEEKEVFLPITKLRKKLIVTVLVIAALGLIFGIWVSKAVNRSVFRLIEGTKKFGAGDFSSRITVDSADEIGDLSASFNEMAENLQQTMVSKNYLDNIIGSMREALFVASPVHPETPGAWPSARITAANHTTCKLLGYANEELVGHPIGSIFPGEELLKREWFQELLEKGSVAGIKKNLLAKDGKHVPVLFSASLMQVEGGHEQEVVCVAQDYTERKQAEETLRNVATSVSDTTGKKFFSSLVQHLVETLDMEYAHIAEIVKENNHKKARTIAACHKKSLMENFEYDLKDTPCDNVIKEGVCAYPKNVVNLFPGDFMLKKMGMESYAGTLISGSSGQLLGLMVVMDSKPLGNPEIVTSLIQIFATRVTAELERKAADEELRKLSRAVEQCPASIVITDTLGTIEYVNPKFCQVTGYSPEEALGQNPRILKSGEMCAQTYKILWETIAGGKEWHGEFHNKKKNGELYWEFASISPVKNEEGAVSHFIAVKEDITQRKFNEDSLQKAKEEAESATQLKDKFVSLVAHDLRSPFATILGFLKMVQDDTLHPLHPTQQKMIDRVVAKGEELHDLINRLLEVSRLKTGKVKPKYRFIDGYHVASHVITDLNPLAEKKGIKILNQIPEPTRLYADLDLFNQVIDNLVSNAIKFSKEGDSITLFIPDNEPATIAVKDTGMGIEKERGELLFKYEENTSTTGTLGEKGTGLGLPLCKDIMEAHKGSLDFESIPGKKTTFFARLPLVHPQIMVVDDDPDIRNLLTEALNYLDARIIEAENGRDALGKLPDCRPHLIISDINMPVMDGLEFLKTLKEDRFFREIPVIVLTADRNENCRDMAFQYQASDFISKPLAIEDLLPRVKRQLSYAAR